MGNLKIVIYFLLFLGRDISGIQCIHFMYKSLISLKEQKEGQFSPRQNFEPFCRSYIYSGSGVFYLVEKYFFLFHKWSYSLDSYKQNRCR